MKQLEVSQGSPAWHAARANCFNASEAPAMMGVSKYMKRSELLKQKATGIVPEVDSATQSRFDMGHEVEAKARPLVEDIIGEELYPIVATDDSGKYLASSDGATMLIDTGFEHKLWNEELAEEVSGGNVPESHRWQLDHQFLVFGFDKILFVVSNGTKERMVHCWYYPQPKRIEALKAGWDQFAIDLANYKPEEVKQEAVGVSPDQLPALRIEVTGMVTASNLEQFKSQALAVFRGINTKLTTDQDFANAEKAVKFCKDAEEKLDAAKSHALSQTESIDALFKTIDAIKEEARTVRLKLDKLVKSEKESRKAEIVAKTSADFTYHLQSLLKRTGVAIPVTGNFAAVISGLKSLDSMRDKLSVALANAKVEANAVADRIEANRNMAEDMSLFPDFAQVCTKPAEDFAALLSMRVNQRKEAEAKRLETERERIRAEEQAKAQREAAAIIAEQKAESDRIAAENIGKLDAERNAAEVAPKPIEKATESAPALESVAVPVVDQIKKQQPNIRLMIDQILNGMNQHQLVDVLGFCQSVIEDAA